MLPLGRRRIPKNRRRSNDVMRLALSIVTPLLDDHCLRWPEYDLDKDDDDDDKTQTPTNMPAKPVDFQVWLGLIRVDYVVETVEGWICPLDRPYKIGKV